MDRNMRDMAGGRHATGRGGTCLARLRRWVVAGVAGVAVCAGMLLPGSVGGFLGAALLASSQAGAVEHAEAGRQKRQVTAPRNGQARLSALSGGGTFSGKVRELTVASWGGAYMQAQKIAYFTPFYETTGIAVVGVRKGDALAHLRTASAAGAARWDVVDLSSTELGQGCDEGLLEPLDATALLAEGTARGAVADDFLPGAIHKCGVASMVWSAVMVVDRRKFRRRKPRSAADFFNIRRFPGRRALPKGPEYTLEFALLADGVRPSEVYALLATDEGVRRAFRQLDRIRGRIDWWTNGAEPFDRLLARKVSMALAFNGRAFQTAVRRPGRFDLVWGGQIYDLEFWAIPKNAPAKQAARAFIKFAMAPERLARQSRLFPYGPTRRSALAKIGRHGELGISMTRYIPTAPRNFRRALRRDGLWWQRHKARLDRVFARWLAGEPLFEVVASGEEEAEE